MAKKHQSTLGFIIAVLALTGFAAGVAWADLSESIPFTTKSGGGGSGCPGAYTGMAQMTNGASLWFTPPTNTTSGTFTDASGFPAPYASVASVRRNDLVTWCDTNSVTFPATNSKSYELIVYVKSPPPPPTNGQSLNLQITWH